MTDAFAMLIDTPTVSLTLYSALPIRSVCVPAARPIWQKPIDKSTAKIHISECDLIIVCNIIYFLQIMVNLSYDCSN